jgi:hypothetical protein
MYSNCIFVSFYDLPLFSTIKPFRCYRPIKKDLLLEDPFSIYNVSPTSNGSNTVMVTATSIEMFEFPCNTNLSPSGSPTGPFYELYQMYEFR